MTSRTLVYSTVMVRILQAHRSLIHHPAKWQLVSKGTWRLFRVPVGVQLQQDPGYPKRMDSVGDEQQEGD